MDVDARPLPAGTLLSVSGLSVAFSNARGETTVVQDVSFSIGGGEALGIVGESGCGKSVTAASLSNILPANGRITSGSVMFDGRELVGRPESELRQLRGSEIGFIPQEPMAALDPVFTVGHLLAEFVRCHHGMSRVDAKRRVIELLEMVRLPNPQAIVKRYPHQLSGGMAQRVAIAAALGGGPRLLIADEPTTALDVTVQAEILDLLHRLRHELDMAILVVSHDWGVIADICERAVVMYAGQVVETATSPDMFRRAAAPVHRGSARLEPAPAAEGIDSRHSRHRAVAGTWPIGLPLPTPLRVRHRRLQPPPIAISADRRAPTPLHPPRPGRSEAPDEPPKRP